VHWPDSLHNLRHISRHENRSILVWELPDGSGRILLKTLAPPYADKAGIMHREEYMLLRKLRHPNLVQALGFREFPDGHLVMAMAEARGVRVDAIETQPCWTPSKASIARQILAGLDPLHRAGFVHADLKPDHVFVEETANGPSVTLLDLGLATRQGDWVRRGTLGWIPPEIWDGSASWSVQSDLYLFGLILHQVIYGEPLFSPESDLDSILLEIRRDKRAEAHEHVDPRLREILDRLIDPDPKNRPSRARAVWEELREVRPTDAASLPDSALCAGLSSFHGRDQEIEEFADWLASLAMVRDRVDASYRVRGEYGIGKSALIDLLVAKAETMGWTPQPLPEAAGDSASPIRAALLDPKERVRVEIGEAKSSALRVGAGPKKQTRDREEHEDVPFHREVTLEPLPRPVAQRIAQDALDGDALSDRVAVLSLGNPRLLAATCRGIEWLTEFAWRDFREIVEDRFPERGSPPEEYVIWLQEQAASLPPGALDSLAGIALLEWWSPWLVEEATGRPLTSSAENLKPFFARGLVFDDRGTLELISQTWRVAAVRASGELRKTVRSLLERTSRVRAPSKLVKLVELVIQLELWEELGDLFHMAVRALLDDARHHEIMVFLYRTYNAIPENFDVATPDLWRSIAEVLVYTEGARAFAKPTRLAAQPPPSIPPELRAMLHAYFLADAGRKAEGRELLTKEVDSHTRRSRRRTPDPFIPPSVPWIAVYMKVRILSDLPDSIYPELLAQLREWMAHPRFANPSDQFDLRFLAIMRLAEHLSLPDYLTLLEPMREGAGASPWKNARFHLLRAAYHFHSGNLEEAKRDADVALDFFQAFPSAPLSQLAYQTSAAIAYEAADFKRAYTLGKRLVRIYLVNGRIADCTWQLRNLALVEVARGQLGMALAQMRMAEELHVRAKLIPDDTRRPWLGLSMRSVACDPSVTPEIVRALEEHPRQIHLSRILGLHELDTGNVASGRARLRSCVERFAAVDRKTEAVDVLACWLEREVDLGNRDQAEGLFLELQKWEDGITPKVRAHLSVIETDMLVLDWLEPHRHPEAMLLDSILDIRDRDFGFHFWRTHWNLARFYHQHDRAAEAAEHFRAAKQELQRLMDTLENEEQREGFRNCPGPRRFLTEADSWEVPE
jgi:tetratricopeptide (TPR) repeat protein